MTRERSSSNRARAIHPRAPDSTRASGLPAHVRTDTAYEQSEAERAGKTGADAATGTLVFEAVAPGTATVTVDEVFRGTTETSTTFTIVVIE